MKQLFLIIFFSFFLQETPAQTDTSAATVNVRVSCFLVNGYDEAIDFYTKKLGFTVAKDARYGENKRWVSLAMPSDPNLELSLGLAASEKDKTVVGKKGGSFPFLVMVTTDFDKTYQDYKPKEVEFLSDPEKSPWGMGVSFKDLYGNIIYLEN